MTSTGTTSIPTTPPPIRHREAMRLAETAYARFAGVVENLDDADWDQPTDCDGWDVRDLVGHVVGAMRSSASMREFVSQQREIKRRVAAEGGVQTEVMTQVQLDRTAALTRDELTVECRALVPRATAGRRRVPAPLRRLVTFPVEIGSLRERWHLGFLLDVILTRDAWLHRIDVCRAIGAEPELTPEHDGRIVADVAAEWARRHGQPYRLTLTGPAGGTFGGEPGSEGGAAAGTEGGGADVDRIELDAVEFCRIVSGRATGTGLLATEVPF